MINAGNWEGHPLGYTTVDMLLDDVSEQMASSNITRYSRGSNGQKAGGSMRIVKPSSASNSPRGSIGLSRRRTVMSDGAYRRRLALLEQQHALARGGYVSNDGLQISSRTTRPVSWHPSSHNAPRSQYQSSYQVPQYNTTEFQMFDASANHAAYSGYGSPSSTLSPLSMPFNGYEQPQYLNRDQPSSLHSNPVYSVNHQQQYQYHEQPSQRFVPQTSGNTDPTMYSHFDWNNFATSGFENCSTAPPTPENFLPIQHPEPTFSAEESIPYLPLSEPESDGEELIGMGLYDAPEVKSSSSNPELDNYRALMMTGFLGTGYGKTEASGKGLKLEETWNPPPSDDEDDEDDDDDEQDGEAEDDDEPPAKEQPVVAAVPKQHIVQTQMNFAGHGYGGPGWL